MAIDLSKGYEELFRLREKKSTSTLELVAYGPGIAHRMAIEDHETNTVILSFDAFESPGIPHDEGWSALRTVEPGWQENGIPSAYDRLKEITTYLTNNGFPDIDTFGLHSIKDKGGHGSKHGPVAILTRPAVGIHPSMDILIIDLNSGSVTYTGV